MPERDTEPVEEPLSVPGKVYQSIKNKIKASNTMAAVMISPSAIPDNPDVVFVGSTGSACNKVPGVEDGTSICYKG